MKHIIAVDPIQKTLTGSTAEATVDPVGNWKLWPFSFKRSNSRKGTPSPVDDCTDFDIKKASDRNIAVDGEASIFKHQVEKKMVRSISPTSEQLASLNLKDGGNTVTFTFYTAMLGKQQVRFSLFSFLLCFHSCLHFVTNYVSQQVEAKIYLWKWNTRVVISDVDGTITKYGISF